MNISTINFRFINWVKTKNIGHVLVVFILIYVSINLMFGALYYRMALRGDFQRTESVEESTEITISTDSSSEEFLDYVYFSFITASTIGYGDYYPTAVPGRVLVVAQSVFGSFFTAIMLSIITSKLLWPTKNTVIFSKKIVYNTETDTFQVRILNTNTMPIINPDIRMTVTQHGVGDFIANVLELDNSTARPTYLGKHDYILNMGIGKISELKGHDITESMIILSELKEALAYEKQVQKEDSRFRIAITITGSNGVQNIADIKKYYPKDFVSGLGFDAIRYGEINPHDIGIDYKRIPDFWTQFDAVKHEKEWDDIKY